MNTFPASSDPSDKSESAFDAFVPNSAQAAAQIGFRFDEESPWLLLAAGIGVEVVLDVGYCRIPNTPAWFHGLINLRGAVAPVFDVQSWLNERDCPLGNRRILVIGKGDAAAAVLCAGEPRAMRPTRPAAAAPTIPQRLRNFVSDGIQTPDGPAYAFDHRAWFTAAGHQGIRKERAKDTEPVSRLPRN
jgi:twitching motility protein PilI